MACVLLLVVAAGSLVVLEDHVWGLAVVRGASMEPTLHAGQIFLVDKVSEPRPGELVVFRPPADWEAGHDTLVKRVIAVSGSRVACCTADRSLVVDSLPLSEPYLASDNDGMALFDRFVPQGHVWVLGDNRASSNDSAAHLGADARGAVPTDRIIGVIRGP